MASRLNIINRQLILLLRISALLVYLGILYQASGLQFELSLSNTTAFDLQEKARWISDPSTLELINFTQTYAVGRVVYNSAIQFKNYSAGEVFNFSTYFSFQINIARTGHYSGDGLAFFIAPYKALPSNAGAAGGGLGLITTEPDSSTWGQPDFSRHLLAVEFDTFLNSGLHDPSNSHIAIDIDGLVSKKVYDTDSASNPLYLYKNSTLYAWIQYDGDGHTLQVWANTQPHKPSSPILDYPVDLSQTLLQNMYVGLSAADDSSAQQVYVFSWNFAIDGPPSTGSSAPSTDINTKPLTGAESKKSWLSVGIVAAVAAVLVLGFILCLVVRCKRRSWGLSSSPSSMSSEQAAALATISGVKKYSYRDLRKATNGFNEQQKVGEGGFSVVYKAQLDDGPMLAVKKLKKGVKMGAEFAGELQIINQIRHRNLVELKGWCYENGEAMLLYEFMGRGSLEAYIFPKNRLAAGYAKLHGEKRLEILMGVAAALEYLHEGLGKRVLHRDVKAANVLLGDDWTAKLGDFGLARLITHDNNMGAAVTMTAAGTPGYLAPEVIYTGKANDRADVYSFGVLALEVACGRQVMDGELPPQEMRLIDWVWLLHQSEKLLKALDPEILLNRFTHIESADSYGSYNMQVSDGMSTSEMWRCVLHVGLLCCLPYPDSRPSMRRVCQALRDCEFLPLPLTWPTYGLSSLTSTSLQLGHEGSSGSSLNFTSTSTATSVFPPFSPR